MTTQKQYLSKIRSTGAKAKLVDGEYQVSVPGRPQSTYYTPDGADAYLTAVQMMNHHSLNKKFGVFGA